LKHSIRNIVIILTGLLLLANVFSYLGEYSYFFELFTHFRVQYLLLFLISSLFFGVLWNKKWLMLSLMGLALNAFPVGSLYLPANTLDNQTQANKEGNKQTQTLSVLLSNVLSSNHRYDLLLNQIEVQQPDLIIVLELNPLWANALKTIEEQYPHNKIIPRNDNFGIALYSKHPLHDIQVLDFAQNSIPSISANYQIEQNKRLQIIATHPLPPMNASLAEQQIVHLQKLAAYINILKQDGTQILLAGDFNSTPWSPLYKNLIKQTTLTNTRQGFGIYSSWPTKLKSPLLQIPLDHIFISKNIHTRTIKTLQPMGSDHLPVYVELEIE